MHSERLSNENDPFDAKWQPLEEAVVSIQKKKKAETSLEHLYEVIMDMSACFSFF